MSRILIITKGMTSALNNSLELARRLCAAGHDVAVAGPQTAASSATRDGFAFSALTNDVEAAQRLEQDAGDDARIHSLWRAWQERRKLDRLDEIKACIARNEPDVLVLEIEMHTAILVAARIDIPAVLLIPWCSIYRDWSVAPMHTSTMPNANPFSLRGRRDWISLIARRVWNDNVIARLRVREVIRRRFEPIKYRSVDRRVLARLGRVQRVRLRSITSQSQWLLPHAYTHLPVLAAVLPDFDLDQKTPENFHYIGPLVHPDRGEVALCDEDLKVLEQLLLQVETSATKLVYCAVGTRSKETLSIAHTVVGAFRNERDIIVVIGLGGNASREAIGPLPDHIAVLDYAPQVRVLRHADVAIIHGGIASINECILNEVPMVVHAGGDVDQPGCAVRVEHHGLGIRVDLATVAPSELGDKVQKIMSDTGVRARLADLATSARHYEDDRVAERLIEQAIRNPSSHRSG